MIAILPHKSGAILPVLAYPRSKRAAILGERAGALRVAVTSPPESGRANDAIESVLAQALGCKKSQITLISGAASRRKRFLIGEMTATDLKHRIAVVVPQDDSHSAEG